MIMAIIDSDPPATYREYRTAKATAADRHNAVLKGHTGYPISYGNGIGVACACGTTATFDGYRDHIIRICMDTPVRA